MSQMLWGDHCNGLVICVLGMLGSVDLLKRGIRGNGCFASRKVDWGQKSLETIK